MTATCMDFSLRSSFLALARYCPINLPYIWKCSWLIMSDRVAVAASDYCIREIWPVLLRVLMLFNFSVNIYTWIMGITVNSEAWSLSLLTGLSLLGAVVSSLKHKCLYLVLSFLPGSVPSGRSCCHLFWVWLCAVCNGQLRLFVRFYSEYAEAPSVNASYYWSPGQKPLHTPYLLTRRTCLQF